METNNIKKATQEVFEALLTNLSFDTNLITKNSSMHCASTVEGYLKHNPELKAGMYKDAVYFIFRNGIPMKIGKVGGGNRCMKIRCNDYRSIGDAVGRKILDSMDNGDHIDIWALYPPTEIAMNVYGFGVILTMMPQVEKLALTNADKIGLPLEWNSNKG
tara:strand:+ start:222 stop:701 length:480 start_codon:yes stop_codon:yes gene_type:complete